MQCNIEIQLQPHQYENERILYYWADTYRRQLKRGNAYGELNRTISIVILDHEIEILKGIEELGVKWQIRDDKTGKRVLTDRLEIIIIELPKAKRIYDNDSKNKIVQWMMFLDNPNKKEVVQIMAVNKDIRKAIEELEQVSGDEKLQRIAELREKAIRDEKAALAYALDNGYKVGWEKGLEKGITDGLEQGMKQGIEQGIEQGMKQGIEQGMKQGIEQGIEKGIEQKKIEIVKNMLKEKVDIEVIEKVTEMKKEEIEKIKKSLDKINENI